MPTSPNFEWALLGQVDNSATAGQNVGVYGQGNKVTSGAGPTWSGVMQAIEKVATTNPTTGTIGLEVDVQANNTDANIGRVLIDAVLQKGVGSTSSTASYGLRLGANAAGSTFSNGIFFNGANSPTFTAGINFGTAAFGTGIDLSAATFSGNAIQMAAGQQVVFGGTTGINGSFSTGTATPTLSANKPGANGSVAQWLSVKINGTQLWVPAFAN